MNAVTRLPQWVANGQLLTIDVVIVKVSDAWTQFQARIETRFYTRRNSRHQGDFFIVADAPRPQFMTGWKGYFRVGRFPCMPVVSTFPACHQSSLRPWVTGSKNTKNLSYDCLPYCRFARQKRPFICPFCNTSPDAKRQQLPRSHEDGRPAECCHCCQLSSHGGRCMNRKRLLENALIAVNCQKAEAQRQLKQAEALHLTELVKHWTQQIQEHEATRVGLLEWLLTLDGGDQ